VLLEIQGLRVSYGAVPAVNEVDIAVERSEVTVVLGANGAGKTTIIKSILGLVGIKAGSIKFDGHELVGRKPHDIFRNGIAWVPEGRQLWRTLSVRENMELGAFNERNRTTVDRRLGEMWDMFPVLRERSSQLADSLSGGEQQMLALARALMSKPQILLMDEPSLGLAPLVVARVFSLIREIKAAGVAVLLVEQNAAKALDVADTAYLLEVGRVTEGGTAADLKANARVTEAFLGAAPGSRRKRPEATP